VSNDTDEIYATCLWCGQYGIGRDHDKTCPEMNESPAERALRYLKGKSDGYVNERPKD
jgi:hypothetical protein